MGTWTMSLSGSGVVNGSKAYTISDADVQTLIDTIKAQETARGGTTPTNAQALLIFVQQLVDYTTNRIQSYNKTETVPPPIQFVP